MNLGPAELLVIILFAFIIIGPEKLPQVGKSIGKAMRKLRDTQGKIDDTLREEGLDPQSIQEATRNPFLALEKVEKMVDALPHEEDDAAKAPAADAAADSSPVSPADSSKQASVDEQVSEDPQAGADEQSSELKSEVKQEIEEQESEVDDEREAVVEPSAR